MSAAPMVSVLRHTATALHVVADKLTGQPREELFQRAAMLTDVRSVLTGFIDAALNVSEDPTLAHLEALRRSLKQVRGEA